jgi:hypothetical protein
MEGPADTDLRKPKEGIVRLESSVEGGKQSLTTSFGRVDFCLEGGEGGGAPRLLGAPGDMSPSFVRLSKSLLGIASFPPATRLAFGTVMELPARDKEEGYRQLSAYLPFQIGESNSSDFLYRINRPRNSRILNELRINRVSVWSLSMLRQTQLTPSATGHIASSARSTGPQYACRVELDINTDAQFTDPLNNTIFDELVDLAKEIYTKGDIA